MILVLTLWSVVAGVLGLILGRGLRIVACSCPASRPSLDGLDCEQLVVHPTDRAGERHAMNRRRLVAPVLITLGAVFTACSTTHPRRDPTGEVFPTVTGTSLAGQAVTFPDAGRGAPLLLLLIGYDQDSQFDLDRWIQGLDTAGAAVRTFELPTIPGMVPRLISGRIDDGMRRGIPSEDWPAVVTLYGDASKITAFTGNQDGLPGRIVLLDQEGKVVFFHDRGFSLGALKRLLGGLQDLL